MAGIVNNVTTYTTIDEALKALTNETNASLEALSLNNYLIEVIWNNLNSRSGRATYSIKNKNAPNSDLLDIQEQQGPYIGANFPIPNSEFYLSLNPSEHLNTCVFGAIGDGVSDDTDALQKYWAFALKHKLEFNLSVKPFYKLGKAFSTLGEVVYFSTEGQDNVCIKMGESELLIDPQLGQGHVRIFECKGTHGFYFDQIKVSAVKEKVELGNTISLLTICHKEQGSRHIKGGSIIGKNATGVRITTDLIDYTANGMDSRYRSKDIMIDKIDIDNSEMTFILGKEYFGYGLCLQCSGDNLVVNHLKATHIHRTFFAYGLSNVQVRSGQIKESDATTVNLGGYGSCENIQVNLKVIQDHRLPTELTRVLVYENDDKKGGSLDLAADRPHICAGIKLNLVLTGKASENEAGFSLNKTYLEDEYGEPIEKDGDIEFRDIDITIEHVMPRATRAFSIFSHLPDQLATNMKVKGIRLSNSRVSANGNICLPPNMEGDIIVSGLTSTGSVHCNYGDKTTNALPIDKLPTTSKIVFKNSSIEGSTATSRCYDCPITFINSEVATTNSSYYKLPAQNKTFVNSKIGGELINKSPWSIYTPIFGSNSMYRPALPLNNLVLGGHINSSVNLDTQKLILSAPKNLKTAQAAHFYLEQFLGNMTYQSTKSYYVTITAVRRGSSGFALAKGNLTIAGASNVIENGADDVIGLSKAKVVLDITSVVNTDSYDFKASDFSLKVTGNRELTLECRNSCADLYFNAQHI